MVRVGLELDFQPKGSGFGACSLTVGFVEQVSHLITKHYSVQLVCAVNYFLSKQLPVKVT